jgi:hypothetical protein
MNQTHVNSKIINYVDGGPSIITSVELNLLEIEKAQELRYNSNEFNDWMTRVYGEVIDDMSDVEKILVHVTQTPEIDFVEILESGRNVGFELSEEKYVIMGFNEESVTAQLDEMQAYVALVG